MTTTLTIPPDLLSRLRAHAAQEKRTVEEELLELVREKFGDAPAGPQPSSGGGGLEYIPSPEIPAPFDLEPSEPGVRVTARNISPPPLEFWFDEDKVAE